MTVSEQVRSGREAMVGAVQKELARQFFSHTVNRWRYPDELDRKWDLPDPASGLAEGTAAGEVTLLAGCWK